MDRGKGTVSISVPVHSKGDLGEVPTIILRDELVSHTRETVTLSLGVLADEEHPIYTEEYERICKGAKAGPQQEI